MGGEDVSAADSAFGVSGVGCAILVRHNRGENVRTLFNYSTHRTELFVVAGVRKDITVQDVFKGVTPFFAADVFTIAVLIAFPSIVLWLPSLINA